MKTSYVLSGFGIALIMVGFALIILGSAPISPWSKDNFVYIVGIMTSLYGMICIAAGILSKEFLIIFFKSWLVSLLGILLLMLLSAGLREPESMRIAIYAAPFWALLLSPVLAIALVLFYRVYRESK